MAFADGIKVQEPTTITATETATTPLIFDVDKQASLSDEEKAKACAAQAQVLSQAEMDDTKGAAPRSYRFVCIQCAARHGGVYSDRFCYNCWNKGYR